MEVVILSSLLGIDVSWGLEHENLLSELVANEDCELVDLYSERFSEGA